MKEQHPPDPAISRPPTIEDFTGVWPGRRTLSTTERVMFCLAALALVVYLSFAVGTANWTTHPVLAGSAGVVGVAAVVWLVASAWARRPNRSMIQGSALRGLDRPTRRALVRELRAGRQGPVELRPHSARWTCQNLQAPWTPAIMLALLSGNAGIAADGPISVLRAVLLVGLPAVNVAIGVQWFAYRPGAQRVADALDELAPPPPRSGTA